MKRSAKYLAENEDLALELELRGSRFTTDETVARHGAAVGGFDAYERLPALVIHGADDPIIPVKNGELLAIRIPGSVFMALEGIGHLPAVAVPLQIAGLIQDFPVRHHIVKA